MAGMREFRRDDILLLLEKLAREMQRDNASPLELIVVGGSALALLGLRESTHDIDSLTFLQDEMQEVISDIGIQDDLGTDWLNDRARAFVPDNFEFQDCVVVHKARGIRVLVPPPSVLFLMKLNASRGSQDFVDMVLLWPRCVFRNSKEVVDAFWKSYPQSPPDPFLIAHVDAVLRRLSTEGAF